MKLLRNSLLLILGGAVFFTAVGLYLSWAPDVPVDALKARWAQPPSQFVALQGMQVHFRDEGPGAGKPQVAGEPLPIVLLHGTSASLHTWNGWAAELSKTRRVLRFDLPGFALTGPQPQGDYSMAAYSRFVLGMLDQLGIQRCVLAGNSLGGQIAWATALQAPQRVGQLVLIDAAGYPMDSESVPIGFKIARMPGLRWLVQSVLPRGLIEQSVRNVYAQPDRVTPELVDLYYDITRRAGNRAALGQRMDQRDTSQVARLKDLKMPTLILWGAQDRLIPPRYGQAFAKDIADSQLVVLDGLGHVPHEEDPARSLAALQPFLSKP